VTRALLHAVAVFTLAAPLAADQAIFRSATDVVAISVSVKRGNAPVANLTTADFALYDNDVPQTIEALTIEAVPLDVTLFMDTSGSTSGALDRMKRSVSSIVTMLRPDDRFRLLTIGLSVQTAVPWQRGGRGLTLDVEAVPGISLIYDALSVALAHEPEAGRRHLVVALTDGEDCGSVVDGERVLAMSARSDAVLHWIWVSSSGDMPPHGIAAWCTPSDVTDTDYLARMAVQTGGETHRSRFGDPAVRTFARILDEFRRSYVLRYSPAGVPRGGWHQVRVAVPRTPGLTIKSRSGYFGGE
jgi:Ca-activated chloride channel family protein